jgi:hypothetical protein
MEKIKDLNENYNLEHINKPPTFYDELVGEISKIQNDDHIVNDKNTFVYNEDQMVDEVREILYNYSFRKQYSKRHPIHRMVYITTYENSNGMRVLFYRNKKTKITRVVI